MKAVIALGVVWLSLGLALVPTSSASERQWSLDASTQSVFVRCPTLSDSATVEPSVQIEPDTFGGYRYTYEFRRQSNNDVFPDLFFLDASVERIVRSFDERDPCTINAVKAVTCSLSRSENRQVLVVESQWRPAVVNYVMEGPFDPVVTPEVKRQIGMVVGAGSESLVERIVAADEEQCIKGPLPGRSYQLPSLQKAAYFGDARGVTLGPQRPTKDLDLGILSFDGVQTARAVAQAMSVDADTLTLTDGFGIRIAPTHRPIDLVSGFPCFVRGLVAKGTDLEGRKKRAGVMLGRRGCPDATRSISIPLDLPKVDY